MNLKSKKSIFIAGVCVLIVVAVLVIVLCAGGGLDKKVNKSLKTVQTATLNVAVKDGETEVYSLNKTMSFIDGGANVTTVTKKLNANTFDYKEETISEFIENITAKDSVSLNLNKKNLGDKTKDGNVVTVTVLKSNANEFFGVTDAKADSDILVVFVFANNKLQSITITYQLISGKSVELTATYTY